MYGTAAAIFSILLIITGLAKVRSPGDVARALSSLGLPNRPAIGVGVGVVEIMVGATALLSQTALAAQALLYLGFVGWIALALTRDVPIASCGCLGKDDTPPTWAHLVVNGLAVLVSLGAAVTGPIAIEGMLSTAAQFAIVAVGVVVAYIVINDAARLVGVRTK